MIDFPLLFNEFRTILGLNKAGGGQHISRGCSPFSSPPLGVSLPMAVLIQKQGTPLADVSKALLSEDGNRLVHCFYLLLFQFSGHRPKRRDDKTFQQCFYGVVVVFI